MAHEGAHHAPRGNGDVDGWEMKVAIVRLLRISEALCVVTQ